MKELHYLSADDAAEVIRKANIIKKTGVKCVDVSTRPLVETATGNKVLDLYEVVFKGNWWQLWKAKRLIQNNGLGKDL